MIFIFLKRNIAMGFLTYFFLLFVGCGENADIKRRSLPLSSNGQTEIYFLIDSLNDKDNISDDDPTFSLVKFGKQLDEVVQSAPTNKADDAVDALNTSPTTRTQGTQTSPPLSPKKSPQLRRLESDGPPGQTMANVDILSVPVFRQNIIADLAPRPRVMELHSDIMRINPSATIRSGPSNRMIESKASHLLSRYKEADGTWEVVNGTALRKPNQVDNGVKVRDPVMLADNNYSFITYADPQTGKTITAATPGRGGHVTVHGLQTLEEFTSFKPIFSGDFTAKNGKIISATNQSGGTNRYDVAKWGDETPAQKAQKISEIERIEREGIAETLHIEDPSRVTSFGAPPRQPSPVDGI